jgi:hypothetical protein
LDAVVDDQITAHMAGPDFIEEGQMSRWDNAALFFLGLLFAFGVASLQALPGYLDSDYYYVGGLQLVQGKGFTEPFLWNYLDEPEGIPHPSHAYWFPLASILAAASMFVTGAQTYAGARLIYLMMAAFIPVITANLAMELSHRRALALTSGLLAVFSIYHAPFTPVTDNFSPLLLLGGCIFLLAKKEHWIAFWGIGLCSGLMHLARNDGLLWLGLSGFLVCYQLRIHRPTTIQGLCMFLSRGLLVLAGYLLVMAPWFTRNILVFGAPLAPGGSRILWLTNYNDTFAFPANQVNMQAWLAAGWQAALRVRLWALRMNLLNTFAAQGGILLFPFILIGIWQVRQTLQAKMAILGWTILILVMTLLFPFAGARGGFFHAGAAFQPFWWAVAPLGLERLIELLRKRELLNDLAYSVFRVALVGICLVLTGIIIWLRIIKPGWQPEEDLYMQVEQFLNEQGASQQEIAIVRNPPGYFLISGRSTIVMPPGGPDAVLALADHYGATYFVLEPEGVLENFQDLYDQFHEYPGFEYLGEVAGARIFAIQVDE